MKILLAAINAKYIHSNPAIYSLRACVKEEHRDSVFLAEYTINQYAGDILADLYRQRPDVIGFSVYIWNRTIVEELLRELPKVLPEAEIWLGGPEVSYGCEEHLKDYPVVKGVRSSVTIWRERRPTLCGTSVVCICAADTHRCGRLPI